MEGLIKKLGYGVGIHYNEYTKMFQIYKLGTWYPGMEISKDSVVIQDLSLEKSIEKYLNKS